VASFKRAHKSPRLLHWCNNVSLDSVGVNLVVAHMTKNNVQPFALDEHGAECVG
jgi:hypothetical protein